MMHTGPPPRVAECMFYVPRENNYCICEQCIRLEFEAGTADPRTAKAVRAKGKRLKFRCHGCLRLQIILPTAKEAEDGKPQEDSRDLTPHRRYEDHEADRVDRACQHRFYLPSVQDILDDLR